MDEKGHERFHLSLPYVVFAAMESARGDVPRSRWLQRLVERELGLSAAVRIERKSRKHEEAVTRGLDPVADLGPPADSDEAAEAEWAVLTAEGHDRSCGCARCDRFKRRYPNFERT